jgi:RNA polymerase sigma-70 factor, ECF subfamily
VSTACLVPAPAATVLGVSTAPSPSRGPEAEAAAWIAALSGGGPGRDAALESLHALLLRAARFELHRRRRLLGHLERDELDDLAMQSADDALVAVLAKLGTFRGQSRFTTWAYKFALLEAGVKARRRVWHGRELPLTEEGWARLPSADTSPADAAGMTELLAAVRRAIADDLTPHQRDVLVALTLNDVPVDVLADRMDTTRGALYKTLHDARKALRRALERQGLGDGEGHRA